MGLNIVDISVFKNIFERIFYIYPFVSQWKAME